MTKEMAIEAVLSSDCLQMLRSKYRDDSLGISKGVAMFLAEHGVPVGVVTFRNGDRLFKDKVTYWSQSANAYKKHRNHAIVLIEGSVIDILSSSIPMDIDYYVELLARDNHHLKVVDALSGVCDSEGHFTPFERSFQSIVDSEG